MFFVYFLGSFRFNICFVMIFLCLTCAFSMVAGAFWQTSNGAADLASKLLVGGGAFCFAASAFVLYLWVAIVLAVIEFPLDLPGMSTLVDLEKPHVGSSTDYFVTVGDLSRLLTPKDKKIQVEADKEHEV